MEPEDQPAVRLALMAARLIPALPILAKLLLHLHRHLHRPALLEQEKQILLAVDLNMIHTNAMVLAHAKNIPMLVETHQPAAYLDQILQSE
jgi:hypothetical protein